MNDFNQFRNELLRFATDHSLPMDIISRLDKCAEEDTELQNAIGPTNRRSEGIDRLITGFLLCESLGIKNPLQACFDKLEECRERDEYKKQRGEIL